MDLSQEDWKSEFESDENAFLLDVRTPDEFEAGHIPDATLLNINDPQSFIEGIKTLDLTKNYYVYCRSGARSAKACQVMNQIGIEVTKNLLGGFMEWEGETA
tara:strand:- start:4669 stop:4974 length:306 start_codon:yes stop_codon:yes gene_type:complete